MLPVGSGVVGALGFGGRSGTAGVGFSLLLLSGTWSWVVGLSEARVAEGFMTGRGFLSLTRLNLSRVMVPGETSWGWTGAVLLTNTSEPVVVLSVLFEVKRELRGVTRGVS